MFIQRGGEWHCESQVICRGKQLNDLGDLEPGTQALGPVCPMQFYLAVNVLAMIASFSGLHYTSFTN